MYVTNKMGKPILIKATTGKEKEAGLAAASSEILIPLKYYGFLTVLF
jgi:hypothetical protein